MLHTCIDLLKNELNKYIRDRAQVEEDKLICANLGAQEEALQAYMTDKIVMTLVDIMEEKMGNRNENYVPQGNSFITKNPPVRLNLHILFTSQFSAQHLLEGLKYLSLVIAFFQAKSLFKKEEMPVLQQMNINSLGFELMTLSQQEQSELWNRLRAPYVPSVLYKIGVVIIEDMHAVGVEVPQVRDITF